MLHMPIAMNNSRQHDEAEGSPTSSAHLVKRLVLALVIILSAVAGMCAFRAPGVAPATAAPDDFSAERALVHVLAIAQEPHPMGSPQNARVRDYIVEQLDALGLSPEIQTSTVPDYFGVSEDGDEVTLHNIVVRLPGYDSTKALALVGHYDSVPTSFGASDDGAAVAAMLETARALQAGSPLRNDVILVFTDGEEPGDYRYGARTFVGQHRWASDIGLVLNFEALGSTGPSVMFETGPGNAGLIDQFSQAASLPVAFSFMNELYRLADKEGTDFIAFEEAGIGGFNFAFFFERTVYHTALDNAENLNHRSLQHHGNYALELARHFGNLDLAKVGESSSDAVYFSLFGLALVSYPETWALPSAILIGLLLIGGIVFGVRRRRLTVSGFALGATAFILSMMLAVVLLSLAWWGIDEIHLKFQTVVEPVYKAHLLLVGFLALTVVIAWAIQLPFRRRVGNLNILVSTMFCWWLASMPTSVYLPGFSYLFTWPLLFSLPFLGWILWKEPSAGNSWLLVTLLSISAIPALLFLTPAMYGLFQAFGVSSPGFSGSPSFPIIGLSILLWFMLLGLLGAHLEFIAGWRRKRLIGAALLIAVVCILAGSLVPGISIEDFGLGM